MIKEKQLKELKQKLKSEIDAGYNIVLDVKGAFTVVLDDKRLFTAYSDKAIYFWLKGKIKSA